MEVPPPSIKHGKDIEGLVRALEKVVRTSTGLD
jgi:hypothetical protein